MAGPFKAWLLEESDGKVTGGLQDLEIDRLPEGNVTIAVEYSTLNYKDGMILNGIGKLVRSYPHIPGVDFAGTVETSDDPRFKPGDKVVSTGWRVGEAYWGGYTQKARVKGDWLLHVPEPFDTRLTMAIGTAGVTAALALDALEYEGLSPKTDGQLLITGASGGVGSVAVALAAKAGYQVTASTGRAETHQYLMDLGAAETIDRRELSDGSVRPLDKERWIGAIDNVGSTTLAKLLSQMRYRSAVAACGLVAGADLPGSVIPFLLRGVRLVGIDSVMCPREQREAAWARLARDLPVEMLETMTQVEPDHGFAGSGRGRSSRARFRAVSLWMSTRFSR